MECIICKILEREGVKKDLIKKIHNGEVRIEDLGEEDRMKLTVLLEQLN